MGKIVFFILMILFADLFFNLFLYEKIKYNKIVKYYDDVLDKILSGNFTYNFQRKDSISNKIDRLCKDMLVWIYKTLNSSITIGDDLEYISNSCSMSKKGLLKIRGYVSEFNKNANAICDKISECSNLSANMANSEVEMGKLSDSVTASGKKADEYITRSSESVEKSVTILENMNSSMELLSNNISNLSNITDKIENMAELINKLTANINLLSLNASIEAARAGENGKGFAIVALEIGKLADESAVYSKNIKSQVDEIKGHTVDTVKSIEDLIEKSSQGKDSIKSIKNYFSEFSSEIHNINNNLAFLSQKIVEQTEHTQYVAAFNQNLAAFFADFKRDVSVIVVETENQSALEDENIECSQKMHFSMEKLTDFTKEFEKIIESKLIEYCNDIAEKICKDNFTIEKLCEYVGKTNISSFYITDGDGVIVMTNDSETMGFRFEDNPSSQTFQFRKILSNRDLVVVQDFVKIDLDGKYYKFAGISRRDKKGIVQASISMDDIVNLRNCCA